MTQRQLKATNLFSQSAGSRKLCPGKIADPIVSKAKKLACFRTSHKMPACLRFTIRTEMNTPAIQDPCTLQSSLGAVFEIQNIMMTLPTAADRHCNELGLFGTRQH